MPAPAFDAQARERFDQLLRWRRDVRWFRPDPVDADLLRCLLEQACLAPSVGLSQPWRFVLVESPEARRAVVEDFERCRTEAEASVPVERRGAYGRAKLEGLREAPVHLAAFTDAATARGHGLGVHTMPECLAYSTVMAVHTLWLAARQHGLGLGWVSILDPAAVARILAAPPEWKLTAYLCLGYPRAEPPQPELEAMGWERRADPAQFILRR